MIQDVGVAARYDAASSMQPLTFLVGTQLHFSDQMLRLLGAEFQEVLFERTCEFSRVFEGEHPPRLIILHESVPDLRDRLDQVRLRCDGAMIAIASSDIAAVHRTLQFDPRRPISLLQLNTPIEVWLSVLRLLLCGHHYVPVEVVRDHAREAIPLSRDAGSVDTTLTPRELQILPMIAQGMQNKNIACELGLSEHTVKLHTHNIFSKLKVSNRTGAANWYLSQAEGSGGHVSHAK